MIKYTFIALLSILISCNKTADRETSSVTNIDSLQDTASGLSVDTTIINDLIDSIFYNDKVFISIIPSSRYLDSLQKIVPEDEWNEVASDNEYYRDLTSQFLLDKGYKLKTRPNGRFWYFKLKNGRTQIIDTVNLNDTWGNLIFNGKDSAFIFESASPDIELKDMI